KTSQQVDEDRETLRQQILGDKMNLTLIQEELIVMIRAQAIHTRTNIDKYLSRFRKPLNDKLLADLNSELPTWQGNLWRLTRRYEEWLEEHMVSEIDHISATEHKHFFGAFWKAHASLDRYVESIRAFLGSNVEKVLGVTMIPAEWKIEVAEPTRPDISIGRIFDFNFDVLWFLIPMFLFRRLFERHFIKQIPRVVYVNFSRLAAQWEERINRAIEDMRKQAANYIKNEIATIDALLSQSQDQTEEIRRLITKLQEQSEQLAA
ncbi:MAG: hypothetical protein ABSB79_03825, partial [Syntrophales bacterium]